MNNITEFKRLTYEIPEGVTFYNTQVERGIAFFYGLSTNMDTTVDDSGMTTLIKFPAGRYVEATKDFSPFFDMKPKTAEDIKDVTYPEFKAYKVRTTLYCIKSADGQYYNAEQQNWTTDINQTTFYFYDKVPSTLITTSSDEKLHNASVDSSLSSIVQALINNGVQFPCVSFVLDNITDYVTTEPTVTEQVESEKIEE